MSIELKALSAEQFAAFQRGDEQVFESLVRSTYDSLLVEAHRILGEHAGGAPRVVTGGMLAAWADREKYSSAGGLNDFLIDAVSRAAADDARRRASLHRFEKHEHGTPKHASATPIMDASGAWQEIHSRLHTTEADLEQHRREVKDVARSHAAQHLGGAQKKKLPIIPIVLGLALIGGVWYFTKMAGRTSDEMAVTKALGDPEARSLGSGRGQRGKVTLGDGTVAQMGSDTHLRVPPGFNAQVRAIGVDGTAQFTVADGQKLAFRARAKDVAMTAHGKVFAVRAFEEEPDVIVSATDGTVEVHPNAREAEAVTVNAGSAMAISKDGKTRTLTPEEKAAAFSWVDGTVTLNKMPLKNVLNVVSRWYDTHVKVADPALDTREVTATLRLDSSKEALEDIATAANGHLGFIGDTLVIADGLKAAPAAAKKKAAPATPKKGK